jgi:hypothetical protein
MGSCVSKSSLFLGQIPSYKASNLGFSVFMGIFNFSINNYLLVYELNKKSKFVGEIYIFGTLVQWELTD